MSDLTVDANLVADLVDAHTDHTSALERKLHGLETAWLELLTAAFSDDAASLAQVRAILRRHTSQDFLAARGIR